MSIRNAAATVALIALLAPMGIAGSTSERAQSSDPDQALRDLRQLIAPSPEAERDYAVALEIWKRMNVPNTAPADPRPGLPRAERD
ncbi:MAG TPA: hypothetical protein VN823_10950 [Stellaceae bacterium]|nr:hypothetical protein [Stellaceae bacterium]